MTTTPAMNFAPDHGCKTDWLLDGGLRASPSPRRSSVGRGGVFLPALGEHRTFNIEHPTSNALPKGRPLDVRCWEFEVGCFPLSLGGPRVVPGSQRAARHSDPSVISKWFWWCRSRCDRPVAERSVRRRNRTRANLLTVSLRTRQCGRHSSQRNEFYPTGFGPAALPNVLNHSTCIAP
jgi:hypothetical protein